MSTFGLSTALVLLYPLILKAEEIRAFDLRIEIDETVYSPKLCQKLVDLHNDREVSPWGMLFAQPSRFCSFPKTISKAYSVRMWRLVLNELTDRIRLTLCRPIKRHGHLLEDCPWSIAFEKRGNWRESLEQDEYLFLLVAGLHEKLPLRDFSLSGLNLSRHEPRFESDRLQSPPRLVAGKLELKKESGRLLFNPIGSEETQAAKNAIWWLDSGDKILRSAAFTVAVENAGQSIASGAPKSAGLLQPRNPPPLAAPPPTPLNQIQSRELTDATPTTNGPPTDTSGSGQSFWHAFWNGAWQTRIGIAGLPMPDEALIRMPSLGALSVESRHPFYRTFSLGILARYEQDREGGELLVNTALNRETQFAIAKRTTASVGLINTLETNCSENSCMYGLNYGYRSVTTNWKYDREKTTLLVWAPNGNGLFVEPWFQWSSVGRFKPNGFIALARYTDHLFNDAQARVFALEGAWHWGDTHAAADLGAVRIRGWEAGAGIRVGSLEKTGPIRANETGVSLSMTGFWLSLKLDLDEVIQ